MRSALFQFFIIKAMTIENIENHMAYTCKCGGVNFALLKSGEIECNKCSTPLDDVKWWAGGMGAQLARAIKAEAERDTLKAAMPVGELTEKVVNLPIPASAADLKSDIAELIQSHKYKGLRSIEVLGVFQFIGAEIISGSNS